MLELNHGFRVVDVHARLDAAPDAGTGRASAVENLEREMHQAGVVRAVVYPGSERSRPDGGYVRANNAVARRAVERPFVAFARINGPRDPGTGTASRLRNVAARRDAGHTAPGDVEQYAYDDRFHGFKLDPARDGLPDEQTVDALDDVSLPVLVHAGESFPPTAVAETLLDRSFPVVLEHFGGCPPRRDRMDEAVDLLDRHENLFLDTSAVRLRHLLERAIREHPDRVLFGSGAPAVHHNVAVMEILTLDVPADLMSRVLSENSARVVEALGVE